MAAEFLGAFSEPRHLSRSAWLGHIPFAFWIVEKLRPTTIVELGTHTGASYFAFCQAVAELKLPTACYAVDTWEGDEHAGFYDESVFQSVHAINAASYSDFSQLLRMTFDEALDQIGGDGIDLLHIDGLHTYDAVKHDFETWLPRLSDRAVVLLHDTRITRSNFLVYQLFAELSDRYPCFEFQHSAGLGVVFVGKDHDPKILDALKAASTQMFFQRLGERIEMAYQLRAEGDETKAKIESLKKFSDEKEAAVKRRDIELARLKEKVAVALSESSAATEKLRILEKETSDRVRVLKDEIKHLSDQDARRLKEIDLQVTNLAEIGDLLIGAIVEKEDIENKQRHERALRTFLYFHSKKRRYPLRYILSTRKAIKTIRKSREFDAEWYLGHYPDVKKSGVDPVEHYYCSGVFEGRNPSASFNTVQYLLNHTDVAKAGINPLLHYVRTGKRENRRIEPAENGR